MRGEGAEKLAVGRECELPSGHPMARGTGISPGAKEIKCSPFVEGGACARLLGRRRTPSSAESLLTNVSLLLPLLHPHGIVPKS